MKPGDLVRLVADPETDGAVVVGWMTPADQQPFDEGTVAMFLGDHTGAFPFDGERKVRIMIGGRLGWIYESECEAIDEAG